ncbi:MAG: hypothetical protein CMF52_06185 [Legionellales bacterium]|nr:hypothetical protein [Legionellales bacterium]
MTKKEYSKDDLMDAAGGRVDKHLNDTMMVDGRDDGLDVYFAYEDKTQGFRIVDVNTIQECHGYSFSCKADIVNDIGYINLPQEMKDLIPEDDAIFTLSGTLKTGEVTVTHWSREQSKFAQKVACDWWDMAEGEVLEEWGIEYDEVKEN